MKTKIIHSIFCAAIAIFFIYKGYSKINSDLTSLEDYDYNQIQVEQYDSSEEGEKPAGYKITMNTMKQSGFLNMIGIFQIVAGILILIPISRLVGLLFLLPIIFNIFFMHVFFDNRIGENIETGILLAMTIILISYYYKNIVQLFNPITD
tara:strand:- start:336 stop:785 length:450 start_codon:yes stop_codon:yes gene_type:complete